MTAQKAADGRMPVKTLLCSSEMEPFAKTGGLGDVTAALSKTLSRLGNDVKVFLPKYKSVYQTGVATTPAGEDLSVLVNGAQLPGSWEVYYNRADNYEVIFIVNDDLYLRDELYVNRETGMDYEDNDTRFLFYCRAIFEICKRLNWKPDIIHANDWQASPTTVLLRREFAKDEFFKNTRSALTIHNAAYQGIFDISALKKLGVQPEENSAPFSQGGKLNLLKSAVAHADVLTAVSERYAVEIQSSSEYGRGLEGAFRQRNHDLFGVLNGVDYEIWNPSTDKLIPHTYDDSDLSGKVLNKRALQVQLELTESTDTPLVGMVSRLTEQKGIELFLEISDDLLDLDVQMVILGDGSANYIEALKDVQRRHPQNFRAVIGFDNKLAHLIEAGSDMFLIPSRYEPCGLNQMYSLRYGTPPIVRETGGLADTISEFDPQSGEGVGFVFRSFSSDELLEALCRALDLFPKKEQWLKLVRNGMAQDFSWKRTASRYDELYRRVLAMPPAVEKRGGAGA